MALSSDKVAELKQIIHSYLSQVPEWHTSQMCSILKMCPEPFISLNLPQQPTGYSYQRVPHNWPLLVVVITVTIASAQIPKWHPSDSTSP